MVAVLASPVILFYAFRLRAMSSAGGVPDPGLHTSYIWDPQDTFLRFAPKLLSPALQQYLGPPAAYLREGARTGFLVPARLAYLAFGAVPAFFFFRYMLALVAVVPTYVLLKRLYGRGAGALAIVVVMSAPVIITAWGTDFPDSAEVSYLIGGFACLVMPASSRRAQIGWTAAAGALLTLSVWALASSALLIGASLVVWVLVRAVRARRWLLSDIAVLATVFIIVTGVLALVWWALSGQFDYLLTTVRSLKFLMTGAQEELWHSSSWRWATYDNYLLVLPAVALAWLATFCRSHRSVPSATLTLGGAAIAQLVVAALAQFFDRVEVLENHYFSSGLWAISTLVLVLLDSRTNLDLRPAKLLAVRSGRPGRSRRAGLGGVATSAGIPVGVARALPCSRRCSDRPVRPGDVVPGSWRGCRRERRCLRRRGDGRATRAHHRPQPLAGADPGNSARPGGRLRGRVGRQRDEIYRLLPAGGGRARVRALCQLPRRAAACLLVDRDCHDSRDPEHLPRWPQYPSRVLPCEDRPGRHSRDSVPQSQCSSSWWTSRG